MKKTKLLKLLNDAPDRYLVKDPTELSIKSFEKLLPDTIPPMIKEDISHYFNYLKHNRSKKSLLEWEKASGCIDSPNSWRVEGYRPLFSFLYYDRVTDGSFLALLLNRIEPLFEGDSSEMSIDEFNRQCRLSIIGYKPDIDTIDLRILQELSKDPTLVLQELTERTGHSYAAVYNHFQKLKDKLGLRILTRINWTRLGIKPQFLIVKEKTTFKSFDEFKPSLDGEAVILWGNTFYLRYYFLTDNVRADFVKKYKQLKQAKVNIELFDLITKPQIGWGFDFYNQFKQRWDFDFNKVYRHILSSNEIRKQVKKLFQKPKDEEIYTLTPLETKIIDNLVRKYDLTQKELAEHLGMHAQNLSTIKLKLLNEGIIYPRFEIRNFQPIRSILWLKASNQAIFETLIPLLQKLPFSNISLTRSHSEPEKIHLISFLFLDDILYKNLASFVMQLFESNKIDDFQIGLNLEAYFGKVNVASILKNEEKYSK